MNLELCILTAVQQSEPDVDWHLLAKRLHIEKEELDAISNALIAGGYISFSHFADRERGTTVSKYRLTGKGKLRLYELSGADKSQTDDLKLSRIAAYAAIAGCILSAITLLISTENLWLPLLRSLLS